MQLRVFVPQPKDQSHKASRPAEHLRYFVFTSTFLGIMNPQYSIDLPDIILSENTVPGVSVLFCQVDLTCQLRMFWAKGFWDMEWRKRPRIANMEQHLGVRSAIIGRDAVTPSWVFENLFTLFFPSTDPVFWKLNFLAFFEKMKDNDFFFCQKQTTSFFTISPTPNRPFLLLYSSTVLRSSLLRVR